MVSFRQHLPFYQSVHLCLLTGAFRPLMWSGSRLSACSVFYPSTVLSSVLLPFLCSFVLGLCYAPLCFLYLLSDCTSLLSCFRNWGSSCTPLTPHTVLPTVSLCGQHRPVPAYFHFLLPASVLLWLHVLFVHVIQLTIHCYYFLFQQSIFFE